MSSYSRFPRPAPFGGGSGVHSSLPVGGSPEGSLIAQGPLDPEAPIDPVSVVGTALLHTSGVFAPNQLASLSSPTVEDLLSAAEALESVRELLAAARARLEDIEFMLAVASMAKSPSIVFTGGVIMARRGLEEKKRKAEAEVAKLEKLVSYHEKLLRELIGGLIGIDRLW